jgi:Tfp pilus assembly protein FimV
MSSESLTCSELQQQVQDLRASLRDARKNLVAREHMEEGMAAQLVVQNLTLTKLNEALNRKENKKKNDRTVLFNGRGLCLTADEIRDRLVAMAQQREDEAAEKEQRVTDRTAKRNQRATFEAEWANMKHAHEVEVKGWEEKCVQLGAEGFPKKDWPKKPNRPKKAQLLERLGMAEEVVGTREMGEVVIDGVV